MISCTGRVSAVRISDTKVEPVCSTLLGHFPLQVKHLMEGFISLSYQITIGLGYLYGGHGFLSSLCLKTGISCTTSVQRHTRTPCASALNRLGSLPYGSVWTDDWGYGGSSGKKVSIIRKHFLINCRFSVACGIYVF